MLLQNLENVLAGDLSGKFTQDRDRGAVAKLGPLRTLLF